VHSRAKSIHLKNTQMGFIKNILLTIYHRLRLFFCHYIPNHIIAHFPFYGIRHFYYKAVLGVKLGRGSSIHMGAFFYEWNLEIGVNTAINRKCHLDCRGGIKIGNNVSISPECAFITGSHDYNSRNFKYISGKIDIEDFVWIGSRATILPNVKIGKGAVVCAGAVVTKDVECYTVVGGVPAKVIGKRSDDLNYSCKFFLPFD